VHAARGARARAERTSHAASALAADARLPPIDRRMWYQGGSYCSDQLDGGIERAPV
jgi:hypothetical protein